MTSNFFFWIMVLLMPLVTLTCMYTMPPGYVLHLYFVNIGTHNLNIATPTLMSTDQCCLVATGCIHLMLRLFS